ncbi:hypothetical protein [Coleofasciculus sp. FACHB-SPT9]|uniref:hypothetical protein n=1 Tax=Cyanophyceae TaxID=3028117 RepID=UPI001689ADB4|nr:hypothetical protein [Coleofasciculus sp. FACHB-SPT9]MBD1891078.1 hypothetical protein [Coleofasciculus sp. FACHB-SPT9]
MSTDPIAVLRQNSQRPMVLQTHLLDLTRVAIASTSFSDSPGLAICRWNPVAIAYTPLGMKTAKRGVSLAPTYRLAHL